MSTEILLQLKEALIALSTVLSLLNGQVAVPPQVIRFGAQTIQPASTSTVSLVKVDVVGRVYYNDFLYSDGSVVRATTTADEYWRVATVPKYPQPTRKDAKWISGFETTQYATQSGWLEEGQYAEVLEDPTLYLVYIPEEPNIDYLPRTFISPDGKLDVEKAKSHVEKKATP